MGGGNRHRHAVAVADQFPPEIHAAAPAVRRQETDHRLVVGKIPSAFRPEADVHAGGGGLWLFVLFLRFPLDADPVVEEVPGGIVQLPEGIGPQGVVPGFQVVRQFDAAGKTAAGTLDFYPHQGLAAPVQHFGIEEIAGRKPGMPGGFLHPTLEPDRLPGGVAAAVIVQINLLRGAQGGITVKPEQKGVQHRAPFGRCGLSGRCRLPGVRWIIGLHRRRSDEEDRKKGDMQETSHFSAGCRHPLFLPDGTDGKAAATRFGVDHVPEIIPVDIGCGNVGRIG